MNKLSLAIILFAFLTFESWAQTVGQQWAVRLSAEVSESPASIRLRWPSNSTDDGYQLFKRNLGDDSWGNAIATLSISDTNYTDYNVEVGKAYEYKIIRFANNYIKGFGYIYAGIKVPPITYRGGLILLVESSLKETLHDEIQILTRDIIADGWRVYTLYAGRNDSIPIIKQKIKYIYENQEDIKCLFILGHVPVPWSGNFVIPPDGHVTGKGDHTDAWPADVYYAELDDDWTDQIVNVQTASRELAWNVPGDGKFDQTQIPSEVELESGRVDLYGMSDFSKNETDLLKRYIQKNHAFKTGLIQTNRRGLIDDHFTSLNLSSTGWDNFAAFFGFDNIDIADYFTTLNNKSYLWSYGCGAGSFTSCYGLKNNQRAYTKDFASDTVLTVFTMLAGSFFGDWDNPNNFLRAPLASEPMALASFWGGIPKWHVFHMALGFHLGFGVRLTQNNTDYDNQYFHGFFNYSQGEVHIALMGDPTLRMHMFEPPAELVVDSIGKTTVKLQWQASSDPDVIGYRVFRASTINGKFELLTPSTLTATEYIDKEALNGNNVYMVRAEKLEHSGSGTYYNLSLGVIDSVSCSWPMSISDIQQGALQVYPNPASTYLNIRTEGATSITIYTRDGKELIHLDERKVSNHIHLDISHWHEGIYWIKAQFDNKAPLVTKFLVR